jgi:catechol 2,3-dioxygenase-like lactoylglutathione lyase family enzyme
MNDIGFKAIKVVALAVTDSARARRFYGGTLGLPPASEGGEQVGYRLGDIVLMLKDDWYGRPTDAPNPRLTIDSDDALATERALRALDVVISDPVERYDDYLVGGFLDSEGNKLWFCSRA